MRFIRRGKVVNLYRRNYKVPLKVFYAFINHHTSYVKIVKRGLSMCDINNSLQKIALRVLKNLPSVNKSAHLYFYVIKLN